VDEHLLEIETGYFSWAFPDLDDRVELRVNADSRDEAKGILDAWMEGFRKLTPTEHRFARLAKSKQAWIDSTPPQVLPGWSQSLHDSGEKIGRRWASRRAEYGQLIALAAEQQAISVLACRGELTAQHVQRMALAPSSELFMGHSRKDEPCWLVGFANGARAVLTEFQDHESLKKQPR
jgi:hypothetical protein